MLVGAVELVSPANKDRPAHREALVSKCAAYLQLGVGLVLVDVVTDRSGDLHRELLARVGAGDPGPGPSLSGSAYRPVERNGAPTLDVWREPLAVGQPLPSLPLWLAGRPVLARGARSYVPTHVCGAAGATCGVVVADAE
jgi:hypothetical protein